MYAHMGVRSRPIWISCFERITYVSINMRKGHQQERHHFAVVRLQQQRRIILHWSWTFVLVIEEKLDAAKRAQEGDGEGKERRSICTDFRWLVPSFLFLSVARAVHAPAPREWNTLAGSSATRHRRTCVFSCMSSFIQYLKVHLIKMTSIYLRVDRSWVTGIRLKHVYLTWILCSC